MVHFVGEGSVRSPYHTLPSSSIPHLPGEPKVTHFDSAIFGDEEVFSLNVPILME